MRSRIAVVRRAAAVSVAVAWALSPAYAADLPRSGWSTKAPPAQALPAPAPQGGWYQGCWNCIPPGGPGVVLGIANAPVVVGAVPPPTYFGQPPRVYLYPVPEVNVRGPVAPLVPIAPVNPRSCWITTGPGGAGYWLSPC